MNNKINNESLELHKKFKGKIQIAPKVPVRDIMDFAYWYTPGVAEPCNSIHENPQTVYDFTNKENTIAIISDGTRVLGLGNIGPEAALPVMEGKSLIFKYLGGVDAVPICLKTKSPEHFIETVKTLEPNFGGINLEDIAQPGCFSILDELRNSMNIPVWHDDQQGTALVVLAGVINSLRLVNKKPKNIKVVLQGVGSANVNIARMLILYGIPSENIILIDSHGIITKKNRASSQKEYKQKWELSQITNGEQISGDIIEAYKGADLVIALSAPKPGLIKKDYIKAMNSKPIVFACANPLPEIWPEDAKEAGAFIVGTGRSDFPNQVNNSLGFPGLFRGVLDVRASRITDKMCIKVAHAIADYGLKDLDSNHILPSMSDFDLFEHEALVTAETAIEEGLNKINLSKEELHKKIHKNLEESRIFFEMYNQKLKQEMNK